MAQSGTFADLWSYIEKEAATLKVLECKTLKACLSTGKCWKQYKMYLALEKTFSAEQSEVIQEWEKQNCMSDVRAAFRKFCAAAEAQLEEMKALGKGTLRDVCMSRTVSQSRTWGGICYRFVKNYTYESLNEEEKEKWKDLERRVCVKYASAQPEFDRFVNILEDNREELQGMQKSTLLQLMCAAGPTGKPEYVFGRFFWRRSYEKLDEDMKATLQEWEALLCVPAVDSVDKFMHVLDRRKVELQSFGASAEISVADHTAAIEMKVFTATMDVMLTAIGYNPLEPISDHQKALDAIRCKNWSMRCVIVEDAAYQSRPAGNSLQVVSVKERSSSFVGTPRPLFAMQAENFRPGIIPVHVTDTHVDAAEQVLDKHDRVIELAEMMIRCSDETPQEHANDHEKGVRITIVGEDPVAESGHKVTLMWVGTLKEVMPVIRMQPQTLLRVIAQPHVKGASVAYWQVVFYANADPKDLDAWCKCKAWQESRFEDEGNKRRAAEMSLQTPLTKVKKVRETLQSPSHSTSAHT